MASLAEKFVGEEWPFVTGVVTEWTAKMIDAAPKLVEVALEKGWCAMRNRPRLGADGER